MAVSAAAQAVDIERPKVQIVDEFGVNMVTGQVTHGLDTVSIGGAMGLSHRISVYANDFAFLNYRGFSDNLRAQTRYVNLSQEATYSPKAVLRVSDFVDSADFRVEVNGARVEQFHSTPPPYTYIAVGDERHTLVSNGALLEWTKPDGTIVKFTRAANAAAGATGLLSEIIRPNGFTITVTPGGMGIQSNTGFQLKSIYAQDSRPMDKPDNPDLIGVPTALTSAASGWSSANPKQVKAINNAVEFCAPTAQDCSLTNPWPTATFDWPAGMPRTMFIGESTVKVTDAQGGITKYRFSAYDLAYSESGVVEPYVPGTEFSPRLVGITPAGSNSEHFTYDFKNIFTFNDSIIGSWVHRARTAGVVTKATSLDRPSGYSMLQNYMGSATVNNGGGGVTNVVLSSVQGNPDAISFANTEDGQINFAPSARNWPIDFYKLSGPPERYEYTRGNLTKVKYLIDGVYRTHREAKYPDNCTSTTRKTCNKPVWIRDANGNTTDYTYHPESGQVATITYPPNKHGIRAQTRYEYTSLRAQYFNSGSSKISGTPIWMKTAEKYCINSSSAGNGCVGGDEVITRFEYDHDNLLLTGVTVSEPGGPTLRTCYQYDIYGNQIGVTKPKAGLSQCN
ncbi:RHS repeat domain-containing protein [Microbulbifer celer]|uniref:YD repeat-containing protein n=1 Tax=Microbulbifer celer TaxID=435905 RepID=A0ABW3UBQ7_9GAMM|nr:hypothetical protein [Microbulbifer celer]UFN55953.1 hypothetical protein LPW13_10215 [Microbulbifer celer]